MRYVLITPAHNEETFVQKTVASVIAQTVKPVRYVIVDDGSTDRTADVVREAIAGHRWITMVRLPPRVERDFAGKVKAFNAGLADLQGESFDIIGNVDADVSLPPDMCEYLLAQFASDPGLGVAGAVYTQPGFDSTLDSFEGEECVAGPLQLFRRKCFEEIGGYVPNRLGGVDWLAVTTARMKGWRTRAFTARRFHHHRLMGTATTSTVGAMYDYGRKDYVLGGSPIWQIGRVFYRMTKPPLIVGGLALCAGYFWAAATRAPRAVNHELLQFHRGEQKKKLKNILTTLVKSGRLEKFRAGTSTTGRSNH